MTPPAARPRAQVQDATTDTDTLSVRDLWHTPPGAARAALAGVSLILRPGEHVALLGHNGSGKSTLARHLNGQQRPQRGSVFVDGLSTAELNSLPAIRRRVGRIFQNPDHQIVGASVEEDVLWGMPRGLDRAEARLRMAEALAAVGLGDLADRPTWRLSGGQKQRLALAGVLARGSRYLICDEPTAMLDGHSREEVGAAMLDCARRGLGLLWITHRLEEALIADRVVLLRDGKVEIDAPPAEALARSDELRASLPATTMLAEQLIARGFDVPALPRSPEALAEALAGALERGR
jgi:energy-coupling factor transport system ATP-binding protein